MTFPAIPVAFTGPTPQRPGADLPQIAGPTGLAVQRFGALLAGLAPHAAQNGPLADAGLLGADPAQDPTTPQKGDVAQLAGAAEGPAQTNDAETADIFQGLGAPEGEENAPVLAPDLSVDLVPNTAFLVAPAQPLPHLPVGGAGDAFTHQNPQFGAPTLPVVGGAVAVVSALGVEMPATPLPGGGQNLAQPSLLRPAHLAAGGSGPFGPLAPATMPLSTGTGTGDALGLWAAAPMADGDYTQYAPPPPALAPAAGASPNSAGQWPAAMAAPQPGLPLSAGPTAADGPQRPLAPAPGPMPAPPLPAAIPVLGPENGPIAALDQGQTSRPNIAQTLPAPSPDYAKPLPPLASAAGTPAPVAPFAPLPPVPMQVAGWPANAAPPPLVQADLAPPLAPPQINPAETVVLPRSMAQAIAPDAPPTAAVPLHTHENALAARPVVAAQLVPSLGAPEPAAPRMEAPQSAAGHPTVPPPAVLAPTALAPTVPQVTVPQMAAPPAPMPYAAPPVLAAPISADPRTQPVAQPVAVPVSPQAQAAAPMPTPAPAPKQPPKQPSIFFPLPAEGAGAPPPRMAEVPVPPAPAPDVPRAAAEAQAVIRQIAAHGPQVGLGELEITLRPEELGRLRLVVHDHAGQTSLYVTADRPETLDLLRRHTDLLMQEFRNQGFGALNVSVGGGAPGRAFGQGQPADGAAAPEAATGPAVPVPPTAPPRLASAGQGMDLRL